MTSPAPIEYHPLPLARTVTIQRSSDHFLLTIAPSLHRILPRLGSSLVLAAMGLGLFVFLAWISTRGASAPGFSWWSALFPSILVALSIAQAITSTAPLLFPITFEITPDKFIHRWRKLTEAQSFTWPRQSVIGVRVGKARIQNRHFKKRGLILAHREQGEILVLFGSTKELEFIAEALRGALGLRNLEIPAMAIPRPTGCRYQRTQWRDGIHIHVPPSHEKTIAAILAILALAAGAVPMILLSQNDNEFTPRFANLARVALAGVIAAVLWGCAVTTLRKIRKNYVLITDSSGLRILESGFARPIDVAWHHQQIANVEVVQDTRRSDRGSLQINLRQGVPLVILGGEKISHLRWLLDIIHTMRPPDPQQPVTPPTPPPPASAPSSPHT